MSDVVLATRNAASNYPLALENLAKRFRNNDDSEAINYKDVAFGNLSENPAKNTLRFFANAELLENPKGANYISPQSVIDWKLKMGKTSEEGRRDAYKALLSYDVLKETTFMIKEEDIKTEALAEQVGGMVGIDGDELSGLRKTIEVFIECGFLCVDDDGIISIAEGLEDDAEDEGTQPGEQDTSSSTPEHSGEEPNASSSTGLGEEQRDQTRTHSQAVSTPTLTTSVKIQLDATDMDTEDLREKLQIIESVKTHDGE